MHYVVSDIHGCFEEFLRLLKKIKFSDNDTLYIIGDLIDRGNKSIELIEYVMNKSNIVVLKGNHDELLVKWYKTNNISAKTNWFMNGGDRTYNSFIKLDEKDQRDIIDYLDSRRYYEFVDIDAKDKYLLVHAGFDSEVNENIVDVSKEELIWHRGKVNKNKYRGYRLVVGHIPVLRCANNLYDEFQYNGLKKTRDIEKAINNGLKGKIMKLEGIIYIDCGCVFGYNLGCLRLEDLKEFYVSKG